MKSHLSTACAMLIIVAACASCYGAPAAKGSKAQNATQAVKQQSPTTAAPATATPTPASPATPVEPPQAPTPSSAGAGPATPAGAEASASCAAVAADDDFVYVLQNGMLYKFSKNEVTATGVPVPISAETPSGAGPSGTGACAICANSGMTYIPGPQTSLTVTTWTTPAAPVCPPGSSVPSAEASGPGCTVSIVSCTPEPVCPCPPEACPPCPPAPCPTTCPPVGTTTCPSPGASVCPPTPPPTVTTVPAPCPTVTKTTLPAGTGAGPTYCPPIATVSAATQSALDCLQSLCGADADATYLQAMVRLNQSALAVSDASAVYLGTTSLQNYATNSIADSKSRISQAEKWLTTKYCQNVMACPPTLIGAGPAFSICKPERGGKAFDEAYKNQMVQFYVDEIALSQMEMKNGLDCQVKADAAKAIRDNQTRIKKLMRCRTCL